MGMNRRMRARLWVLGILSVGMVLVAAIVPPIPQPAEYHQFADQRDLFRYSQFFQCRFQYCFFACRGWPV